MTRTTSLYETCQNLFSQYPLAVDYDNTMILMLEGGREPAFYILDESAAASYVLRAWRGAVLAEIGPHGEPPMTGDAASALAAAVPLPRDGSFFGYQSGGDITVTMTIYTEYSPETPVPGWAVAPREGIPNLSWPPFYDKTLARSSFWDHYRNGRIVDLAPLAAANSGVVFWAHPASLTYPCCAVARDVRGRDGWVLPQGVYVYWQSLRDGETAGPLDEVLAGDVTDLSPRFRTGR